MLDYAFTQSNIEQKITCSADSKLWMKDKIFMKQAENEYDL